MSAAFCPQCQRPIPESDFNVSTDVAYCRNCNVTHSFADLVEIAESEVGVDLQRPSRGTWYQAGGFEVVIGASHRSLGGALGLLAVSLFWNGIVSVFVLLVLSSTLTLLGVSVPEWFPAPEMNDESMGWGMTLFMWIFLTPFMVIGSGMILGFLSCLFGKTEIRIRQGEGKVFTGIGFLGWTRKFDPGSVKTVRSEWVQNNNGTEQVVVVKLVNGKEIKLGSMFSGEKRKFVMAALRRSLRQ